MWIIKNEKYIKEIDLLMYLKPNPEYSKDNRRQKFYLGYAVFEWNDWIEIKNEFIYSIEIIDYIKEINKKVYFICG